MSYVFSLICDPEHPILDDRHLRELVNLPGSGEVSWLADSVAAEIPVPAATGQAGDVLSLLRGRLSSLPIDINLLPAVGRRKRLLVADMDSTMIGQECIDELADRAGLKEHVAAITERAMRGEIAFEPALRERVALLKDLESGIIEELLAERITPMPGAETLVATMRANGAHTALVSGGFTLFTGPIAERLGFREHRGNRLEVVDGRLAGTVAEPILGADAKRLALIELRERLQLRPDGTLAVGDGANDLAMLQEAGLGVAFRAKPAVAAAAAARIEHGDLTALLYLQGYRRDEFVEPRS